MTKKELLTDPDIENMLKIVTLGLASIDIALKREEKNKNMTFKMKNDFRKIANRVNSFSNEHIRATSQTRENRENFEECATSVYMILDELVEMSLDDVNEAYRIIKYLR